MNMCLILKSTYTGKSAELTTDDNEKLGLGEYVVHKMTENLQGKGYHVYFDNFFTSEKLMNQIYKKDIYCCGTVKTNRKNLPKNLEDKKLTR